MVKSDKIQAWLEAEYRPEIGVGVAKDERMTKALEYCAYHLWHMNHKLDAVISEIQSVQSFIMMYAPKKNE